METDIVVVGSGLAGLASATYLARGGLRVTVLERADWLGGRARSTHLSGFTLNLGPHALYLGGAAARILRELGVPFSGGNPQLSGYVAVLGESVHSLPTGFASLVTTDLLGLSAKVECAHALVAITRADTAPLMNVPLSRWFDGLGLRSQVRAVLEALVRVSTYAHAPERLSAGATLRQLRTAFLGVSYLDGGWQTLVGNLAMAAVDSGVKIRSRIRATRVLHDHGEVRGVLLQDGTVIRARHVVVAAGPGTVRSLVGGDPFGRSLEPVRLACLDLGLASLPHPGWILALGIDRPLYLSVHSQAARLAPAGAAVVHVARYLAPGEETRSAALEAELEAYLDLLQPGWGRQVIERRFLPSMVVTHALVEASNGGLRPGIEVAGLRGLHVAGDWGGQEGMLADAALASARASALAVLDAERPGASSLPAAAVS